MKMISVAAGAAMALVLGAVGHAETRGPDSFGYVATDNVNYTFRDITNTGTRVLTNVDDQTLQVALGMNFNFYGGTYTTAFLSSNGVISFTDPSTSYTNVDLSTNQAFGGPAIMTFWDDLITPTNGDAPRGVYFETIGTTPGSRKFVVQQIANRYSIGGASINFQTVLDEASGDVLMRYTQTAFGYDGFDRGASATVGIQGLQTLGQTVQWSYNQAALQDNQSICFTRNRNAACNAIVDPVAGVPEPATWAIMVLGFGGAGALIRRRRTAMLAA